MRNIDINADLGEGYGFDKELMPLISSCSIACGGHYGNQETIRTAVNLAKENGVRVGAHPSFPDTNNFGRSIITMTKSELFDSVLEQLRTFYSVCDEEEVPVHHIKLHGALYNYAARDAPTADAVVEAVIASKKRPKLYIQHGSILHKKAENLLPLVFEAFIDRHYNADLSLVPRGKPEAVITNPEIAWQQLFDLVIHGIVRTFNSEEKPIEASTFCVHGDNPHSVTILRHIRQQMKKHAITLI